MKVTGVNNISFKSIRLIKGSGSQINQIENAILDGAITMIDRDKIDAPIGKIPQKEFASPAAAIAELYEMGCMRARFPQLNFNSVIIANTADKTNPEGLYLFATENQADYLDRIIDKKGVVARSLCKNRMQMERAKNTIQFDSYAKKCDYLEREHKRITDCLVKVFEICKKNCYEAEDVLIAIKQGRFNVKELKIFNGMLI